MPIIQKAGVTPANRCCKATAVVLLAALAPVLSRGLMAQDDAIPMFTPTLPPAIIPAPATTPVPMSPSAAIPMSVPPSAFMPMPASPVMMPVPAPTPADAFTLFEPTNASPANAASTVGRNAAANEDGLRNSAASPMFTLVGTSRIGSRQTAVLKHLSGDVVRVALDAGVNTIPGHELYAVVNHGAGRVALSFPASVPCAEFPQQGVGCDATTNTAWLELTTAAAIAPEPSVQEFAVDPAAAEVMAPAQANASRNPFAILRERNRAAAAFDQATAIDEEAAFRRAAGRFQPRRIAPEDVPPGMRIVSTPFGDRLVEQ